MVKRIITGICLIAAVIPVLIFSHTWLFPGVVALISAVCIFEMLRCIGMHKKIALTAPLYVFAVVFPFLQRIFNDILNVAGLALIAAVLYIAYSFVWVIFSHGKISYPDICTLCLTAFYILLSLNMIIHIRDSENGQYIYFLILIGAWVTDTFAYFTGMLLGKHKLVPDVSPKKTVEGSIGGIVFCAIAFVAMGFLVGAIAKDTEPNFAFLAISGLIISLISQAGDLIMSVIKRHYGVKDFSNILPGHGGMLDRMDSMLAVAFGIEMTLIFTYITGISFF